MNSAGRSAGGETLLSQEAPLISDGASNGEQFRHAYRNYLNKAARTERSITIRGLSHLVNIDREAGDGEEISADVLPPTPACGSSRGLYQELDKI